MSAWIIQRHARTYEMQICDRIRIWKKSAWGIKKSTHWGSDRMATISQTKFSSAFRWMTTYDFQMKFPEMCSLWSTWHYGSICLDTSMALNRLQAIIWTNDGILYWRIYALLGLNTVKPRGNVRPPTAGIFSSIFFNECIILRIEVHWSLFRKAHCTVYCILPWLIQGIFVLETCPNIVSSGFQKGNRTCLFIRHT